jgi:saccharopine dehydrogenase (NADP+, L-glutamate forming)
VSLAVQAASSGEVAPGVSAAPSEPSLVKAWMAEIDRLAQHLALVDHLS